MAINFQRKTLSNGMTVIHEKRELPIICFSLTNKFGASHEPAEIKGISHVLEHLLFNGTKTRSAEQISKEIEKRGGILNAFTSFDMTSFWFKLPSEHLEKGMEIIIDMLKNSVFPEEKFEKEKKVVLEELKMYHDNPIRYIKEKIEQNLYDKPYGLGVSGTPESVSSLKRDFVTDYFRNKYSPENYIITLVGDADFEKVCEIMEKEFKSSGKKSEPLEAKKINKDTSEERANIDQSHFIIGMHGPKGDSKERYVLEVLDSYLASGMSSKLFIEIREKRGLAYTVSSSIEFEKTYSMYSIYTGTTKEAIPKVKELILEGFNNVEDMTETDLEESKQQLIGLKKVSSEEGVNVMNELMLQELINNKAEQYYEYESKIKEVTLDEVKSLAKSLIQKYSTASLTPK